MRYAALVLLLACLTVQAQPEVRLLGVSVMDDSIPFEDLKHLPFWVGKGEMGVVLGVSSGDGNAVIDLDDKKSTLAISDAKGNDLLVPADGKKPRFGRGPFEMSNPVTPDGKTLVVPIKTKRAPVKGGSIRIKGSLDVVVAAGSRTHTAKTDLKPGPVALQGLTVHIKSAKVEKDWNDEPVFKVQVSMKGAAARDFAGLRFLDASGKPLPAKQRESMSGMGARTIGYAMGDQAIQSCTIELKTWDGRKTIAVPFDLTVASPL